MQITWWGHSKASRSYSVLDDGPIYALPGDVQAAVGAVRPLRQLHSKVGVQMLFRPLPLCQRFDPSPCHKLTRNFSLRPSGPFQPQYIFLPLAFFALPFFLFIKSF